MLFGEVRRCFFQEGDLHLEFTDLAFLFFEPGTLVHGQLGLLAGMRTPVRVHPIRQGARVDRVPSPPARSDAMSRLPASLPLPGIPGRSFSSDEPNHYLSGPPHCSGVTVRNPRGASRLWIGSFVRRPRGSGRGLRVQGPQAVLKGQRRAGCIELPKASCKFRHGSCR